MSVASVAVVEPAPPLHAARPTRMVRVGLLGLGRVGQAVVRGIQSSSEPVASHGLSLRIDAAFVRDPQRLRRCPRVPRVTRNPEAFLRGRYDVVIEALGGVEPARTLVARLLGRGVTVVTANKALVASCGDALQRIAARRGAALRYEATALAGVPFIGTLLRRPLVSSLARVTGVVNGTSNYILTLLARGEAASVADAIARAQALGYAEPDARVDVSGRDAADKLVILLRECAGVRLAPRALEVTGIDTVGAADITAARAAGGVIKPVAHAALGDGVAAWVGPAFVPRDHPLATVDGALNGICLSGRFVPDLFFSGPGAGPDVTAATLIDDAVEACRERGCRVGPIPSPPCAARPVSPPAAVHDVPCSWFARATDGWTLTEPLTRSELETSFGREIRAYRAVGR